MNHFFSSTHEKPIIRLDNIKHSFFLCFIMEELVIRIKKKMATNQRKYWPLILDLLAQADLPHATRKEQLDWLKNTHGIIVSLKSIENAYLAYKKPKPQTQKRSTSGARQETKSARASAEKKNLGIEQNLEIDAEQERRKELLSQQNQTGNTNPFLIKNKPGQA